MDDKEIKAFKRLLKEVGIYVVWLKNRKKYIAKYAKYHYQKLFPSASIFSHIIGQSFEWSKTNEYELWKLLTYYSLTENMKAEDIVKSEVAISHLKDIVKSYYQ